MQLIEITKNEKGEQLVSARELHSFLESKQDFTTWIKNRVEKYDFVENEDFTLHKFMEGKNWKHDYILKTDIAKEISMVEGNEKGKVARKYFIEAEKQLRQLPQLSEMEMIIKIANSKIEQDKRIDLIEHKVENMITLDSGKQRKLQKAIAVKVFERYSKLLAVFNGKILKPEWDSLKRKLFSSIHRELKNKFGIASYKDVKAAEFDMAMSFVENWIEDADIREEL